MLRTHLHFMFLNIGHFLDHLFMLIFASVAALRLTQEWGMSYSELIPYATPGFIAFATGGLVAGWLADKWSREGMMVIFFIGIGISAVLSGISNTPLQIAIALTLVGIFASIYHPVGLAMVVEGRKKTGMLLAINGVFGNLGVASAVLITGIFIDTSGWRSAFFVPGIISIVVGFLYLAYILKGHGQKIQQQQSRTSDQNEGEPVSRETLLRIFSIILFTTALGGLVFQSTTFSLPKVFDEMLDVSASEIGWYSFLVFSVAALAQLVVGYLVDKHAIRYVFATVALMQMVFFVAMTQVNGMASVVIAIGFMLFAFGQIPINDVLVGRVARSEWRSRAYSIRYIVTFAVTASAVPFIAWIHGGWGFTMLFAILAVAASLIFLATLFLPERL